MIRHFVFLQNHFNHGNVLKQSSSDLKSVLGLKRGTKKKKINEVQFKIPNWRPFSLFKEKW